jgi:diacylglycerol kinase
VSNNLEKQEERSYLINRLHSFTHAGRGIKIFLKSTHNAWVHVVVAILVVCLGFYFHITTTEWMFLVFAISFVLVSEAFNTAIEIDIDLTSPEFHPYAKDTKDAAAGAVLLSTITAVIIGIIVFYHYVF